MFISRFISLKIIVDQGQDFDTQMRAKNLFLIFILKALHKKVVQNKTSCPSCKTEID